MELGVFEGAYKFNSRVGCFVTPKGVESESQKVESNRHGFKRGCTRGSLLDTCLSLGLNLEMLFLYFVLFSHI